MFDRTLHALWKVLLWLFKILIYAPLFFTAFIIVSAVLKEEESSLLGLIVILLVTFILYLLIYFLKGAIIALKAYNNLMWVPVFIICVAFTCILPVYIVFEPIGNLLKSLSKSGNPNKALTWIFSIAFGAYVYFRYDFLTNIAPKMAFPAYQAGINTDRR
jgi:hypothetical protein